MPRRPADSLCLASRQPIGADPEGGNVIQIMLNGAKYRIKDQNVYMPPFGPAYSDAELAAVANYVIGHFGGKTGRVTPEIVARRRPDGLRGRALSCGNLPTFLTDSLDADTKRELLPVLK